MRHRVHGPGAIRYQLAFDAALTRAVRCVFLCTVFGGQRRRAARRGLDGARRGSVTAIQGFGGSANLVRPPRLVREVVRDRPAGARDRA